MQAEIHALEKNGTWTITDLPPGKKISDVNGFTRPNIILMTLLSVTRRD